MKKQYICSSTEWLFARYFTRYVDPELTIEQNKKQWATIGKLVLVFFATPVTSVVLSKTIPQEWGMFQNLLSLFAFSGFAYLIYFGIRMAKVKQKEAERLTVPLEPYSSVNYIMANETGLYINIYNNTSDEALLSIEWRSIKNVELGFTTIPVTSGTSSTQYDYTLYANKPIVQYFKSMKAQYEDFLYDYPPKFETGLMSEQYRRYNNQFSLYIKHPVPLAPDMDSCYIRRSQIQIPSSWMSNGSAKSLIKEISHHTGKPLIVTDVHEFGNIEQSELLKLNILVDKLTTV